MNSFNEFSSELLDTIRKITFLNEKVTCETPQRIPVTENYLSNSTGPFLNYVVPYETSNFLTIRDFSSSSTLHLNKTHFIQIKKLVTKKLKTPFIITIEPDDEGYIAQIKEFPLFGYGDEKQEAIDNLKYEIESLYFDLLNDNNFSQEWLDYKKILMGKIIN